MKNAKFPEDFLWGAATSSHQIEGNNHNDWTEFEKIPEVIKENDRSGKACDSWNLYETDFDLLQEMNLNAYRFSIEWSRIEPERGKFDQEALAKYRRMLESLRERGIEPIVTLHHFTNPTWLREWTKKENIEFFKLYVEIVVASLGEHVRYWITINEPNVYATMGYMQGAWPPAKEKKWLQERRVLKNFHAAHKQAYHTIHDTYEQRGWTRPSVSMAFNLQSFEAIDPDKLTAFTTRWANYFTNHYTLSRVSKYLDFVGVNFYFSHWVKNFSWNNDPEDLPRSDLGWTLHPEGFYNVLLEAAKYNLPIMVTENGVADRKDIIRPWYITAHLKQMHRAMVHGVNVIGYMHWSLMDNFEWADGYNGRFGLAETNFVTQKRTIRDSGALYGQYVLDNHLPDIIPEIDE